MNLDNPRLIGMEVVIELVVCIAAICYGVVYFLWNHAAARLKWICKLLSHLLYLFLPAYSFYSTTVKHSLVVCF